MAAPGSKTCGKCGGRMEQGFIPEATRHSKGPSEWIEGVPERIWIGLRLRGKRRLEVQTWRCQRCAYLESYAPEA